MDNTSRDYKIGLNLLLSQYTVIDIFVLEVGLFVLDVFVIYVFIIAVFDSYSHLFYQL